MARDQAVPHAALGPDVGIDERLTPVGRLHPVIRRTEEDECVNSVTKKLLPGTGERDETGASGFIARSGNVIGTGW